MTMPLIVRISQYFGFVATEISTLLLLYLIITKGAKKLGTYKYVMLSYSVFSVIYAVVEILTQPYPDESGQMFINYSDFASCFGICGIMGLFITIILICGFLTFRKMESVGATMSFKTKELNNQLFRTLVVQTMVPILTMFTPVGLLVIFPMFSINVGKFANAPSLNAGIYPALDATIAIFMIRDFRDVVICRRGRRVTFITNTSAAQYSVTADI
ncbi:Protein CBG12112 [Caenorhabditis briggsae]|uniref:Protein CBG12112 n=1 Tax=Caenorhabditis briggsae TaxID=6238 RepID=A8XES2_CAEBR|nr:Protein CBG12112 [Caenorhabditis briggsae]CAP31144.2 Protein CBG12112 [Caenorhabditis briggsae]